MCAVWILHWYISSSVTDKNCWLRLLGVQICKNEFCWKSSDADITL